LKLIRFGLISFVVGVVVAWTIWASNFSDFMYLEDLGLEESEAANALRKVNPIERVMLDLSLILIAAGLIALVIYAVRSRRRVSKVS